MRRPLFKNFIREIRKTLTRFLSIFSICALGVAFFVGIRAASPDMKDAADTLFDDGNLADITVMSTSGLTEADIRALRKLDGVEAVRPGLFADAMMKTATGLDSNVRLLSLPIEEKPEYGSLMDMFPSFNIDQSPDYDMDILTITDGRLPVNDTEAVMDASLAAELGIELGEKATFTASGGTCTLRITGFVYSPKYISMFERGASTIGNGSSDGFVYASGNAVNSLGTKLPIIGLLSTVYTRADIVVSGKNGLSAFSDEYKALVNEVAYGIEDYAATTSGTWYVKTRSVNPGYDDYSENTNRIAAVGDVFPLIFFIVAALVCLTTMTRMVEEQRIEMGTLKALGYGSATIIAKYAFYAMSACVLGGFFGAVVGFKLFPTVILSAYSIMYRMPDFATPYRADIAFAAIAAMAFCTGAATLSASWAALTEVPSTLMRPKAPKAGKRVFLEKIGFIWKRLNFTAKVTVRNLFRYKKRFFMSVIGIAGSCALLVTGFGLKTSIFGIIDVQFGELWLMDIQAYAYDPMPLADIEELVNGNEAARYVENTMYCYDNICDAGRDGAHTGNVHVLGVTDAAALEGKIELVYHGQPVELTDDGVVVTEKLAETYSLAPGDTLTLYSGTQESEVRVSAITENYVYHYVYMTAAYYEQVYGKQMQYNGFMSALTQEGKEEKDLVTSAFLKDKRMYTVRTVSSIYNSVYDSLSILNYIVLVLILGSAMLTFVVMLNLTNINIGERMRELATLRVLGFYDKEMYDYVFRENNALAVIGAAAGLVFGKFMHAFVIRTCEVDMVMFVRSVDVMSYVYSFVLTIVFSMMVNLMMRRKVRSIDMVESLKSAE